MGVGGERRSQEAKEGSEYVSFRPVWNFFGLNLVVVLIGFLGKADALPSGPALIEYCVNAHLKSGFCVQI